MNKQALREAIEKVGGRKALAEKVGVTESSVIKWERGERVPRPEKILRIEHLSGIARSRLMPSIFA